MLSEPASVFLHDAGPAVFGRLSVAVCRVECSHSAPGGRVVLALEGGYNLRSVALSIEACAHALLGTQPPAHHQWAPIRAPEQRAIQETVDSHSSFWSCLDKEPTDPDTEPADPILITLVGGDEECQ